MPYIHRHMEDLILRFSKSFPAILLTGARQSGKTTMLQALIAKENIGRTYVSLEDLKNRYLASTDPAYFLGQYPPPVLIDEVQFAPQLFTYIKIHIDQHHNPGDFWLAGSQMYRAMDGIQESLAGRVAILHLPPLSQREIIGAPNAPFTADFTRLQAEQTRIEPVPVGALFARIWYGSIPEAFCVPAEEHDAFYSAYLSSFIDRDVHLFYGNIDSWLVCIEEMVF